ncbi:aminoglycoside phosphotransferase family protein [Catenovulum agarivorans]|uniref:aminoglycoside phosphotransferase family protein n=1 Tax=Catenovulum agarivorans TaxID=1172192 RepID=UPI0002FBD913|nr:aminoglycoside phosphotransferase family protein [Catenovulum agarivorans]
MCQNFQNPLIDNRTIEVELYPAITRIFKHNIASVGQMCESSLRLLSIAKRSLVILIETPNRQKYIFKARLEPNLYALFKSAYELLISRQSDTNLKVHALDMSCKEFPYPYVITSFVEGEVKFSWDEETHLLHAQTLAKLHRKTYPSYRFYGGQASTVMCIQNLFEGCVYYWRQNQPNLFLESFVNKTIDHLMSEFHLYKVAFRAKTEFSMVHGDAHNQNIIITTGAVNLIDWESAYTGDGAIDFAKLYWPFSTAWQHHINDSVKNAVISEYLSIYPDPYFAERVEAWTLFSMFFSYLDHSLFCSTHTETNKVEYQNRMFAKNKIERYFTEKWSC